MEPTVSGGSVCHGKFTVEWLGVVFDEIYPDTNVGGDEFEEV